MDGDKDEARGKILAELRDSRVGEITLVARRGLRERGKFRHTFTAVVNFTLARKVRDDWKVDENSRIRSRVAIVPLITRQFLVTQILTFYITHGPFMYFYIRKAFHCTDIRSKVTPNVTPLNFYLSGVLKDSVYQKMKVEGNICRVGRLKG